MGNAFKWALGTSIVILIWLITPTEPPETNIRLFCANGRVFIEFQEKNNTWGTMWINDDGMPVSCGRDEKTKYKEMT
jgi:hypothetical protein